MARSKNIGGGRERFRSPASCWRFPAVVSLDILDVGSSVKATWRSGSIKHSIGELVTIAAPRERVRTVLQLCCSSPAGHPDASASICLRHRSMSLFAPPLQVRLYLTKPQHGHSLLSHVPHLTEQYPSAVHLTSPVKMSQT